MRTISSLAAAVIALTALTSAQARGTGRPAFAQRQHGYGASWPCHWKKSRDERPRVFNRISTFAGYRNNADLSDVTVSEIVAATKDGSTLVYTDSELEEVGFVDIAEAATPLPLGKVAVGGEPTSVAITQSGLALVGVNTSESFVNVSGHLSVVDVATQTVVAELPLGGQAGGPSGVCTARRCGLELQKTTPCAST